MYAFRQQLQELRLKQEQKERKHKGIQKDLQGESAGERAKPCRVQTHNMHTKPRAEQEVSHPSSWHLVCLSVKTFFISLNPIWWFYIDWPLEGAKYVFGEHVTLKSKRKQWNSVCYLNVFPAYVPSYLFKCDFHVIRMSIYLCNEIKFWNFHVYPWLISYQLLDFFFIATVHAPSTKFNRRDILVFGCVKRRGGRGSGTC